ncbi:MAG: sensor histidine kinase [Sulfurifustaceae bacterium]
MSRSGAVDTSASAVTPGAEQVLVFAPFGRDTSFACEFLSGRGIDARGFTDMRTLCGEIGDAGGAILITEEALLGAGMSHLVAALTGAPTRADLPVLVLTHENQAVAPDSRIVHLLEALDSVTLIARPVHGRTLFVMIRSALRARRKQRERQARLAREVARASGVGDTPGPEDYRALVEAMPLPAFVVMDKTVACANRAAAALIGLEDTALFSGRSILAYVDPTCSTMMAQCLAGASARYGVETARQRWRRADGTVVEVDVRVVVPPCNRSRDALVLACEVTEQGEREARLRTQIEVLQQADRRKNEFMAVLAHELRNPLAPVQNAVHVLRIQPDPPDPKHYRWAIDVITRQIHHMTRLVDDLLDMGRLAHGRIKLQKETIELDRVLAQAVEAARPLTATRRQTLTYASPGASIRVDADPIRIAQILGNLLTNASRYTPLEGHIAVSAYRDGGDAVIVVSDDGIGISGAMLREIFEPFRQGERPVEYGRSGLGLGLTLVRQLAELHGGSVHVHSDGPGKGSSFTVRLPALPT